MNVIKAKVEEVTNYSAGLVEEYIVKLRARVQELMDKEVVDEIDLLKK